MAILEVSHLEKHFGSTAVLNDISFSLEQGQALSIIGASGSGKTTLLRCLNFLEKPDGGTISVGGSTIFNAADSQAVYEKDIRTKRLHFGLVFQNFNLFPHYSVLKNIMDAPIHVQKRDKAEVLETSRALLKKMGLSDKENYYPCQLSGGQQQRVSIARALCMKPKILFFDEPTSALDPELTLEILKVIRDLAKEHMTMVIVTHEMTFAKEVSNRIIFMEKGVIVEETTPDKLFNSDNERTREFLGKYYNS